MEEISMNEIMNLAERLAYIEFHHQRNSSYYAYRQAIFDILKKVQENSTVDDFKKLCKKMYLETGIEFL